MLYFEWDSEKDRLNRAKHGVSFAIAARVWDDNEHLIIPDAMYEGEERWLAIGNVGMLTVLVVVHTSREAGGRETVRIISARRATSHERRHYEQSAFD